MTKIIQFHFARRTSIALMCALVLILANNLSIQAKPLQSSAEIGDSQFEGSPKSVDSRMLRLEVLTSSEFSALKARDEAFQKANDKRLEMLEAEIADARQESRTFASFYLALFIALFGYIIWDRRTMMAPIQKDQRSFIDAIKAYSHEPTSDPKLREILRQFGFL